MVLANSRGFVGGYRTSYAGVSAAPLAKDVNGQMQRDGWWSSARCFAHLESPESVGAGGGAENAAPAGSAAGADAAGAHCVCAGGGAHADRLRV